MNKVLKISLKRKKEKAIKRVTASEKRIFFKTHHLGVPLDNLTRDNYYPDPGETSP